MIKQRIQVINKKIFMIKDPFPYTREQLEKITRREKEKTQKGVMTKLMKGRKNQMIQNQKSLTYKR